MKQLSRRTLMLGVGASASLGLAPFAHATDTLSALRFMTEDYPPYNFHDGKKLRGISVEIMTEIFKRAESGHQRSDIALVPWARGYNLTLKRADHALFSTTRTKEREDLFKWVGPFVPTVVGLTARKDRGIKVNAIDDLSKLRIGVVKDDIGQLQLLSAGVPPDRLEVVLTNEQNYRKLIAGRVDAISYETQVTQWGLQQLGANLDDYEVVYELKRGELYLALHSDTGPAVVSTLQAALDSIKADGTHAKILASNAGRR